MACNTVHKYHEFLQSNCKINVIDIINEVCTVIKSKGIHTIGILSSQDTKESKLYSSKFLELGIDVIETNTREQNRVNNVILNVMGGKNTIKDKKVLKDLSEKYIDEGAEAVMLGCTELPLAISQKNTDFRLFDTLDIMADTALQYTSGAKTIWRVVHIAKRLYNLRNVGNLSSYPTNSIMLNLHSTQISDKGQIVIPAPLRRQLGINRNSKIIFRPGKTKKEITLRIVDKDALQSLRGAYKSKKGEISLLGVLHGERKKDRKRDEKLTKGYTK